MNLRLIIPSSVLLVFSVLLSGCGVVYVAQAPEAINFEVASKLAKDWVSACHQDGKLDDAVSKWSNVNSRAANEESAFLCNLYKNGEFDVVSVEELLPPYCISPVCVFVRRRADKWWGMITVQVAKNYEAVEVLGRVVNYADRQALIASVQYGTQQRNCSKDLLQDVFAKCFWQEPLATMTPTPKAIPAATPTVTPLP